MSNQIVMPAMGEGVIEGTLVRWLKQVGDSIKFGEPVLEIETDKVTVEITAEADGTLQQIHANEGTTVAVGTLLAEIGTENDKIAEKSTVAVSVPAAMTTPQISQAAAPVTNNHVIPEREKAGNRDFQGVRVSPVVARMLETHAIDVHELTGSGRDGRITKQDVLDYLETHDEEPPPPAKTVFSTAPQPVLAQPTPTMPTSVQQDEGDLVPLSAMRRSIADHMVRSVQISPHATTIFEFDFTVVSKHRDAHKEDFARQDVKLTYLPYLVMATVQALKKYPMVNASWTDAGILLKRDIHLGIAVAMDSGLIVPVIRHADNLNLLGLARAIQDVSERARQNHLKPEEVRGGTFTITNHGVSGSLIGTPIINQPQVGILGIGLIEKRLKVIDDAIMIRPCAYISFSFDHRILDGAAADAFVGHIKQAVEGFVGSS
jgi:2-oxoglutarate dehydrogenase E2 component (dihydrolipoamide succinyltransferase)